jgi:hypothetical protein
MVMVLQESKHIAVFNLYYSAVLYVIARDKQRVGMHSVVLSRKNICESSLASQ